MFRSLRSRLILTHMFVSALVLVIVAGGVLIFLINSRQVDQLTTARLQGAAELVSERGQRVLQFLGSDRLNNAFRSLGVLNARGMIIGPRGDIVADTRAESDPPPPEVLARAAASEKGTNGSYGGFLNRWLFVARPLEEGRTLLLLAPRPSPVAAVGQELLIPLILRAGLIALAASAAIAWLISRWVSAPLQKTAEAARSVASGDYDQRLAPSGPDEAHSLATSFNEMLLQVQASQQAMRDFVANVSHELRTPLTSIQGYAQAILDGTAKDAGGAAGVIYQESDRLGRLVDELLDLTRLDTGQAPLERQPVDLEAIIAAVTERLGLKAVDRGIQLSNEVSKLPALIGDGDRLAQVFTNLVDNAITHTPEGGEVRLKAEEHSGWISVHVDDTGPGIPPDELSRIFERFYQLDKARAEASGHGAGLGLAISRDIVEAHGGNLEAQSVVGRGSRFTVRLPIVQPDDETLAKSL